MFITDIDKVERSFITEVSACFTMLEQRIAVPAKSSTGDGEGWAGLGQRQLQFPCSQLMGMSNRTPTIELIHWIIKSAGWRHSYPTLTEILTVKAEVRVKCIMLVF